MRLWIYLGLVVVIVAGVAGWLTFGENKINPVDKVDQWVEWYDPSLGYTIKYPLGWTETTRGSRTEPWMSFQSPGQAGLVMTLRSFPTAKTVFAVELQRIVAEEVLAGYEAELVEETNEQLGGRLAVRYEYVVADGPLRFLGMAVALDQRILVVNITDSTMSGEVIAKQILATLELK